MIILAQVLTTLIAFAVFFFMVKKMFWGPLQETINERQSHIEGEFSRIDSMQAQVNSLQEDYARRLADIEAEARQKMQDAINQGRQIGEQIADQARRDADATRLKAEQTLSIELDKARAELKQDVVRMTLTATEKIIRQNMNETRHREMVSGFVEELARQ